MGRGDGTDPQASAGARNFSQESAWHNTRRSRQDSKGSAEYLALDNLQRYGKVSAFGDYPLMQLTDQRLKQLISEYPPYGPVADQQEVSEAPDGVSDTEESAQLLHTDNLSDEIAYYHALSTEQKRRDLGQQAKILISVDKGQTEDALFKAFKMANTIAEEEGGFIAVAKMDWGSYPQLREVSDIVIHS